MEFWPDWQRSPCYYVSCPTEFANDTDRNRIRALLARHGQLDSLGYFATRSDKSYVFSPTGKAAIAYRVKAGVCLAAGDPVGDVEAWPGAIRVWIQLTQQRAWIPAVLAASETGAEVYKRAGFDALEIGDEAVVEVADFTLDGQGYAVGAAGRKSSAASRVPGAARPGA